MKQVFYFLAFLFSAAVSAQTTVYDINTWDLSDGYAVNTVVNGITIVPGASSNTGAVDTGNHTFTDGYQGSKRLKTNGSSYANTTDWANPNRRYFTIPVSGPSTIKVWYRNGGSGERILYISEGNNILGFNSVTNDTDGKIFEVVYASNEPTTIKFAAGLNAINIYKIEITTDDSGNEPTPEIQESSCNSTINSVINDFVFASEVEAATQYEFKVVNESNEQTIVSNTNFFRFADLGVGNYTYGTTYEVSVRLNIDNEWSDYSDSCPITISDNPTSIMDGFCNQIMPGINSKIYFSLVPQATEYRYSITNVNTNEEQFFTTNKRFFYITDIDNYAFNTQYSIKCQVKINDVFGNFGPSCLLTTSSAPTSKLRNEFCNIVLSNFSQNLYSDVIVGATAYKFKLVNGSSEQEIERSDSRFNMSFVNNAMANTTYNISVAVFFNGAWGPFGAVCNITTPSLPTSQLRPQFCGNSVPSLGSNFYANVVAGATSYRFKVNINGNDIVVERPNSRCFMSAFEGAAMNQTYAIQVAVKIGEQWSDYGAPCSLTVGIGTDTLKTFSEEVTSSEDIKAYPNPFKSQTVVVLSTENKTSSVAVFDLTGKMIQQFTTTENEISIGDKLMAGIYLVQVSQEFVTKNIRVVKQ